MQTPQSKLPGKGWLIFGAGLSVVAGVCAVLDPEIFGLVLTQLLGALCLVSGVLALFQAVFVRHRPHRFLSVVSGVIRAAAGSALFFYTVAGMAALTLILAAVFISEGIACVVSSLRMRGNPAWIWLLLNGVAALVLGGMIYARWPVDSGWVVGLLYGIQSLFTGAAMLMLGLRAQPPARQGI
jgi:uncharacterized membrane protein HdeD (DUF308 family)